MKKSKELIIQQKVFASRERRNAWKKKRNSYLNSLRKGERYRFNYNPFQDFERQVTLNVPLIFSTSEDIEAVLKFIALCKSTQGQSYKRLFFNFQSVTSINAGAISLMLSVIQDLGSSKNSIRGNFPENKIARQIFQDSGILDFFRSPTGEFAPSKNRIIMQGSNQTDPENTAHELTKAMQTVFGIESYNRPLQGALIEMQANAVNHAFPANDDESDFFNVIKDYKPWYLSAFHDLDNKKVYFSFIDNGVGILKTLYKRLVKKATDQFESKSVLRRVFEGEYKSSTRLHERGRGLPSIKEAFDKKAFHDLKIITNDHLYDFESNTCERLTNSFEGTFYIWVLDETCVYANFKNK